MHLIAAFLVRFVIIIVVVVFLVILKGKRKTYDKSTPSKSPKLTIGKSTPPKPPKLTIGKSLLTFLIVIPIGILVVSLGNAMLNRNNDLGLFVGILGICCFFLPVPLCIIAASAQKQYQIQKNKWDRAVQQEAVQKAYQMEHPHWQEEEFYQKANAAGITHIDSESNIARLVLFAQNNNFNKAKEQLIADYKLGKKEAERHQKKALLAQLKLEEAGIEDANTRYALQTYALKSNRYCDDQISTNSSISRSAMAKRDSIINQVSTIAAASQEKEHSWAVHGGIASGIAGPAAGISTAIHIQRENEAIRQRNTEVTNFYTSAAMMCTGDYLSKAVDADHEVERWTAKKQKIQSTLTECLDGKYLLKQLNPSVASYTISETGAVRIIVKFDPKANLLIYSDTPALVDGSIKVCLWVEDQSAGHAVCALPYNGVCFPTSIECVCRKPIRNASEYTLTFEPNYLWAVEKM